MGVKRWLVVVAAALITTVIGAITYIEMRPKEPFYGEWVVTRLVSTTPITAMTDEYAKEFIGKTVTYSAKVARFGQEELLNPRYSKKVLDEVALFEGFHMRTKDFGFLAEPSAIIVDVVEADGQFWTNRGSSFFLLDNDTLVTWWDGGFFEMRRTGR